MRGIGFEVGGRTYTAKAGNGALRAIEGELGKGVQAIVEDLQRAGSVTTVSVIFQKLIGSGLTIDQVDSLIDDLGYGRVTEIIGEAFAEAMPVAEGGDADQGNVQAAAG